MADLPPVETLRAAAAKLRETAKGTTPGPWEIGDGDVLHPWEVIRSQELPLIELSHDEQPDAEWIALVHPGVAEPLADWLDAQAEDLGWHMAAWTHVNPGEERTFFGRAAGDPERLAALTAEHSGKALRVARVLLGVPDAAA